MPIEAVVRNIQLPAYEPFGKRLIPLKPRCPSFKPIKALGLLFPERYRVCVSLFVDPLVFLKATNFRICRELRWRRKNPGFVEDRFDRRRRSLAHNVLLSNYSNYRVLSAEKRPSAGVLSDFVGFVDLVNRENCVNR